MFYKAGQSYYKEFIVSNPATGAAVNADSLPTATANKNGADDAGFVLTVANIDTGRYKITGTVPGGYAEGDMVNVTVAATVSAVVGKGVVDTFKVKDLATAQAVWDYLTSAATTVGSVGKWITDKLDAAISVVKSKTDNIPAAPAAVGDVTTARDVVVGYVDTLEADIRAGITTDHGDGLYGPGTARPYTIHVRAVVKDSDPVIPIPGVVVSLFNADKTVLVDQRTADSMGYADFPANNGDYTIVHYLPGYSFEEDTTTVADADVTHTCEGIPFVIPAPANPSLQTLFGSAKDLGVVWAAGDIVTVYPVLGSGAIVGGSAISDRVKTAVVAANGTYSIPVDKGATVRVEINPVSGGAAYFRKQITVSSANTKDISTY